MKFGEYLQNHLTPEWSSQYISYQSMKDILDDVVRKSPSNDNTNQNFVRQQYFLLADEEFFQYCEKEASKINKFFIEKLAQAMLRLDFLKNELEFLENSDPNDHLTFKNIFKRKTNKTNVDENRNILLNVNEQQQHSNSWRDKSKLKRSNLINKTKQTIDHQDKKFDELKLAFSEYYLMLILIKNYQILNYTGFRKILKKHDKLFETTRGYQWRTFYIDCAPFHTSQQIDHLINEVETLYTNVLESGNRNRAMQRLRVPPLEEKQPRMVTFRLGIFIGMICTLIPIMIFIIIILFGSHSSSSLKVNWRAALHLYRSSFLIIIDIIFFGLNVYGWSKFGVNHVLIFEMDPRNHLTYQKCLEIGTFLMVIWLLSLNMFFFLFSLDQYPYIQPLILILFLILFLINPFPIFYRQSRMWFLKKFFRLFLSPLNRVEFCDFWLGDQLCSLEMLFFDIEFYLCFYINGSNIASSDSTHTFFCNSWTQIFLQTIFQSVPSWFRFIQCLRRYRDTKKSYPHLLNAGKYASTFFVNISNALRRVKTFDYHQNKFQNPFLYLWILTAFISSTYKLIWDIKVDWGFFDRNCQDNKYLREHLIYQKKIYYYISIIINILFRYIWIINIFLIFNSLFAEYSDILGFGFGFIEIFRRFIWNYFRLENEHLNNCGQFRAVRDISIKPTIIENDLSMNIHTNSIDLSQNISYQNPTTTNEHITMETINHHHHHQTEENSSLTRQRINAKQLMDELNVILNLDLRH